MSRRRPRSTADRDRKLELLLHQLDIAADVLHETFHWIRELELETRENLRHINHVLTAVYLHRDLILKERPDLVPPTRPGLWAENAPPYTRSDALNRLYDELRFVQEVLEDAALRVSPLGLSPGSDKYTFEGSIKKTASLKTSVRRKIVKLERPQKKRRTEVSDRPEPQSRDEMLERLNQDLELAGRILGVDCAALIRELSLKPRENISTIGQALVGLFEVQHQIWAERPDLIPESLKEAYETRQQKETAKPNDLL